MKKKILAVLILLMLATFTNVASAASGNSVGEQGYYPSSERSLTTRTTYTDKLASRDILKCDPACRAERLAQKMLDNIKTIFEIVTNIIKIRAGISDTIISNTRP